MIQGTQTDLITDVLEKIPERLRGQVEESYNGYGAQYDISRAALFSQCPPGH